VYPEDEPDWEIVHFIARLGFKTLLDEQGESRGTTFHMIG
jgi:hypothetical protein